MKLYILNTTGSGTDLIQMLKNELKIKGVIGLSNKFSTKEISSLLQWNKICCLRCYFFFFCGATPILYTAWKPWHEEEGTTGIQPSQPHPSAQSVLCAVSFGNTLSEPTSALCRSHRAQNGQGRVRVLCWHQTATLWWG